MTFPERKIAKKKKRKKGKKKKREREKKKNRIFLSSASSLSFFLPSFFSPSKPSLLPLQHILSSSSSLSTSPPFFENHRKKISKKNPENPEKETLSSQVAILDLTSPACVCAIPKVFLLFAARLSVPSQVIVSPRCAVFLALDLACTFVSTVSASASRCIHFLLLFDCFCLGPLCVLVVGLSRQVPTSLLELSPSAYFSGLDFLFLSRGFTVLVS